MATVKLGPIAADVRGSVGGTTFSRGPFGAYIKQRVAPTNPNTDKQVAARALLSVMVDRWLTILTIAQRDAWNAAVQQFTVPNRIGDAIHLTGMQWFIRCNILLALVDESPVAVPPVVPILPGPTLTLGHTGTTGIQATAIGNWIETAADRVFMQCSANLSQTKNFWKGPWKAKFHMAGAAFSALPLLLLPTSLLVADSRVFLSFRCVNDDGSNSFTVIYSQDVGDPA